MRLRISHNGEVVGLFPGDSWEKVTIPCALTQMKGDIIIEELLPTKEGLTYTLSDDGTYYICSKTGAVMSESIEIPEWYEHLPVKEVRLLNNVKYITDVVISNKVETIANMAFYNCTGLTIVIIGNHVTSIGGSAFENCTSLKSVNIPNSVTFIDNNAFYKCTSLKSIVIPNGVTSIGKQMFAYCTSLKSVTIPNSVTSIGLGVFAKCGSLTSIIFEGTIAQWNAVDKDTSTWASEVPATKVICTDGEVAL